MLSIRAYTRFLNVKISSKHLLSARQSSNQTQPAVQNSQEYYEKQLKEFETLTNIVKKPRIKKPQRPPFAKNFFLGIFDTELLGYPQLEKDEVENLEKDTLALSKLLKLQHMINCKTFSDKAFRQNLADHKAIGLQASQFIDGRECNITESARFLEVLNEHDLGSSIHSNEQFGVQTLVKFGNEQLQKKYLYRVMRGELLTAFCLSEAYCVDINSFQTKAELSSDEKKWIINGAKTWVINGNTSDVFIVFALSDTIAKEAVEARITAFLVDKESPGIYINKIDVNGLDLTEITFKDTPVPAENVIGEVHKATSIIKSLINDYRLSAGPACITLTKKIINNLSKLILERTNDTNILYKTDAVKEKIAEITVALYCMESITYLTTGLIDSYENQDCDLESAIVKVFCSENALNASISCLNLVGPSAMFDSHWANRLHKEAIQHITLDESNESLKIILALLGLQHSGVALNDRINKIRNPLFHTTFMWSRIFTNRRNVADDPKLDLRLGDYLHPSCLKASQLLEYCVKRLEFATEILLARHGPEVLSQHMELKRLADCAVDIFVMAACLDDEEQIIDMVCSDQEFKDDNEEN